MKGIENINNKGQLHGYRERYYSNGKLWFKCFFNNGIEFDYEEYYNYHNGKLRFKCFYI